MSDYLSGPELGAEELPPGSPAPKVTPPQGVIMSRIGKDGWVRKYLYRAGVVDGRAWQKQFLVSEIPPTSLMALPRTEETSQSIMAGPELPPPQAASELPLTTLGAMELQRMPLRMEPQMTPLQMEPQRMPLQMESQRMPLRMEPQRMMAPVLEPPRMDLQRLDLPTMDLQKMELPKLGTARPLPFKMATQPLIGKSRLGQAFPIGGGTLPTGQPVYTQPSAPPTAPAAAPAAPEETCPVGPMQLPDGRVINPDDTMTLKDICAILPKIAKALVAPPRRQTRTGLQPVTAPNLFGQPGVGPGGGPAGGGGGIGFGFGGGGGGAPGSQGPIGAPGVAGAQGPAGIGSTFDFVSKTDGDFTAGPGAFIPVPGTLLAFSIPAAASVMFQVQATLGCSQTQNGALGLRIDGTDYSITKRLIQTMGSTVSEFFEPSTYIFPLALAAGAHTVEVLLRGLVAGSECSASGLGLSQTISATAEAPLILICQHSVANSPAPTAALLTIDGINFVTGPFTSGSVVPVPGTLVNFNVTTAGNAQFSIGGVLTPTVVASVTNAILGIRIDGTDYNLGQTAEIQGAGGDRVFAVTLSGSITLPLAVGPHSAELIFGNNGGVNQYQLNGSASQPATLSIIHS